MIVVIGAIIILGGLFLSIWRGRLPRFYWLLFAVGAAIGMVWELGFTFSHMGYPILPGGAPAPGIPDITDLPLYAILPLLLIVSIWDAGLFLVGLVIARTWLGPQIERRFSWAALLVMLIWGQVQSLVIEIYAIETGMWAYAPSPLNPTLFGWEEAQIGFLPQFVWLLGYCAFYAALLKLSPPESAPEPPASA
ncbi:hypothetical protein [Alteraurantiacibacter aestuarii]|uniref:hypothetical protein n=1 Tax=Alteraurantiacibacter aestuarii TaxID=650004 RepID=UPI0031E40381